MTIGYTRFNLFCTRVSLLKFTPVYEEVLAYGKHKNYRFETPSHEFKIYQHLVYLTIAR